MKKFAIALQLFAAAALACEQPKPEAPPAMQDSAPREIAQPQSDVISQRTVLFMTATPAQMDSLRSKHGEEAFYVIADDMSWYRAVAADYLEKKKLPVRDIDGVRPFTFMVNGVPRRYDFKDVGLADVIVLYDPNREPRVTATVDVHQAVAEYFGIRQEPADTF